MPDVSDVGEPTPMKREQDREAEIRRDLHYFTEPELGHIAWLLSELARLRTEAHPATPTENWLAIERLWCEALVPEGPEVIQRVTTRVLDLRAELYRAGAVGPAGHGGTPE